MKEYYLKKTPKSTIVKLIIGQIIFSIVLYSLHSDISDVSVVIWILWLLILIFVIFAIVKATQNKPTLIIDKTGIIDNSSVNGIGKIDWNDIRNIEIRKGVNTNFLCIDFFDEQKILNKTNLMKRFLMKSNKKKLGTICAIPEISINDSLESVLNEINQFRTDKR